MHKCIYSKIITVLCTELGVALQIIHLYSEKQYTRKLDSNQDLKKSIPIPSLNVPADTLADSNTKNMADKLKLYFLLHLQW